jgi:hypothetical protein
VGLLMVRLERLQAGFGGLLEGQDSGRRLYASNGETPDSESIADMIFWGAFRLRLEGGEKTTSRCLGCAGLGLLGATCEGLKEEAV